ncbi:hypothetical protein [Desulfobotulus pelophilus]
MNTPEEVAQAYRELDEETFIRHPRQGDPSFSQDKP